MAANLNLDMFFVCLSNSIIAIPKLREAFEKFYEGQKYRFYELARTNEYYNYSIMQDKSLEDEVAMKRTFGILLCSKDSEEVQSFVVSQFEKNYPDLRALVNNFTREKLEKYAAETYKTQNETTLSYEAGNAPLRVLAYLLIVNYGFDTENQDIKYFLGLLQQDLNLRDQYTKENFLADLNQVNIYDSITISKTTKNFNEALQNGSDLCFLLDIADMYHAGTFSQLNVTKDKERLFNYYNECQSENAKQAVGIIKYPSMLGNILSLHGASYSELFWNMKIDKTESRLLTKIISRANRSKFIIGGLPSLGIDDYVVALLFNQLVKNIKASRDFYFRNNSETQFLEINRLEIENEQLRKEVSEMQSSSYKLRDFSEKLQSQVDYLSVELTKDIKDAVEPFENEISILKSRIKELEEQHDIEKEKEQELFRLREFAFSVQSEYKPEETDLSLNGLIDGISLIIIGGHINWRSKMKNTYPMLTLLDGHNTSIDTQVLLKADIVLLNTGNMSHALYYKVIDYLRKNRIPFDYIGKSINQELLEGEIAEIIKKRL